MVAYLMASHDLSQRRACGLIAITRRSLRRTPAPDRNEELRQRLRALAEERRRWGCPMLYRVILREGFNVRGLNTAATLWCSAAVGVLAASGHLVFTLIATGAVIAIHLFGRPLGRLIDRDHLSQDDEDLQPYLLQVVCRPKAEKYARAQIVQHTTNNDVTLRGIRSGQSTGDDNVTVTAYLLMNGHTPAKLEQLVAELSLQPGVQAVHWNAGDQAQTD